MRLATLLLLAAAATAACAAAEPDVVRTTGGLVEGVRDAAANVRYWRGVPFAEDTSGPNRFMPPVPRKAWSGTLNATAYGHGCFSNRGSGNPDTARSPGEDCLNLNVYAPLNATTGGGPALPVMVWLYGGSFAEGDNVGAFGMYNAAYNAATRNVVVVEPNYRLGPLGFLQLAGQVPANAGLLDQQLALQWVRDNAAAFGGDPDQVTLQGESAGAMSTGLHLVMPGSKGLFHRAIMESNPVGLPYNPSAKMQDYSYSFCKDLGCLGSGGSCNVTCMQAAPMKEKVIPAWSKSGGNVLDLLLSNWPHLLHGFLPWKPTVDGKVLPENPLPALAAGRTHKVDVLVGTNTNEAETFLMGGDKALHMWEADAVVDLVFQDSAAAVRKYYLESGRYNFTDGRLYLSRVLTHFWFRCASEKFATAAAAGGQNAFVYRYNHVFSNPNLFSAFGLPKFCGHAVCHATELPFVFHFTDVVTPRINTTMTPAEVTLSDNMIDYWTNFVKTGTPNADGLARWPAWDANTRPNLVLAETITTETSAGLCADLWDKLGYNF